MLCAINSLIDDLNRFIASKENQDIDLFNGIQLVHTAWSGGWSKGYATEPETESGDTIEMEQSGDVRDRGEGFTHRCQRILDTLVIFVE